MMFLCGSRGPVNSSSLAKRNIPAQCNVATVASCLAIFFTSILQEVLEVVEILS